MNEIGGMWGLPWSKETWRLKEEEEENTNAIFEFCPKISYEFNYHKLSGCPQILKNTNDV